MSKTIALLSLFLVAVISGCDAGPDGPATDAQQGDVQPSQKSDAQPVVNQHPTCQVTVTSEQEWEDPCVAQGLGYCNSAELTDALTSFTYLQLRNTTFKGTCQTGCYSTKDAQGNEIYVSTNPSDHASCANNGDACTLRTLQFSANKSQNIPICWPFKN